MKDHIFKSSINLLIAGYVADETTDIENVPILLEEIARDYKEEIKKQTE